MGGEFERVLKEHLARYPQMEAQDCGKLAYQSEFGPAHFAGDAAQAEARLKEEWKTVSQPPAVRAEYVSGGLSRLHLSPDAQAEEEAPFLAELLCRTAKLCGGTAAGLSRKLETVSALELPEAGSWAAEYVRRGCPPVSHSEAFRRAYQPHYRVIRADWADAYPALAAVRRQLTAKGRCVVSIDGRCGSGKTRLAELVKELFGGRVCHTDDYYLPPDRRQPGWESVPGANMEFARLRREVLEPAAAGEEILYRAYRCREGRLCPAIRLPAAGLTVVEGSYSQHPALRAEYDLKIFLTCAADVQARRLQSREGAYFSAFQTRWIPLEEAYLRRFSIQDGAAVVLDTGAFCGGTPTGSPAV